MLVHLYLLLLLFSARSLGQPSDEIQSLLEFKKGINADPSGLLASWNHLPATADGGGAAAAAAGSGCSVAWHGVACDSSGSVSSITLPGLGLAGELKLSTLLSLRSLRNLTLAGNALSGRLPPQLGSISSLRHLDLSSNLFYGPVPARIADLWGLVHLNLSSNQLSGGFPTEFRNLQQLRVLDLRSNDLWGDTGVLFSELRNAEHLDLSGNRFYGRLDLDVANLSNLANTARYLNLSGNRLSGGFFKGDVMRLFRNLEVLDLGQNQISGQLPDFDPLPSLRVFRAGKNLLFGSIPDGLLGSAMPLLELDLSGNGFTGYIRDINSTTLKVLSISSNALSGSLPSAIGSCVSVDLSGNLFSGDLSAMKTWGNMLAVIDLSSNALSGNFLNETFQFQALTTMKIRNNSLVGSLPSLLGSYQNLAVLDLSLNKFTGPLEPSLFTSLTLTSLNLSGNSLIGSIPLQSPLSTKSQVQSSYSQIETLDLSDNSLSGSLPPELGSMQRLKLLNLGKNTLSGELPSEISKLSGLEYLDLSANQFEGRIPDMFLPGLKVLNLSYNNLSGTIPQSFSRFPSTSFQPGNALLVFANGIPRGKNASEIFENGGQHSHFNSGVRVALIVGSIGAVMLILFALTAFYVIRSQEICGSNGFRSQIAGIDVKFGRFRRANMFKSSRDDTVPITMSFSNDHLLTSAARSMSAQKELLTETVAYGFSEIKEGASEPRKLTAQELCTSAAEWKSSPGSPLSSSPRVRDSHIFEQPVTLDVYSPDRLAGELFFLDHSLVFTAEELSRAPAEVLGRSSHGTSYKATLDSGHMLTVKWLRVGLVKRKKESAKEAKRIGSIIHPNIISWRAYYWGPREQERLIIADYVAGDSLALYLHESTPRRYSRLSVSQRLKISIDITRCLCHLHHDVGIPHGNLKPTNILLSGPALAACLTDYGLHRLITPSGTAEQILNLGALGYRAPELATVKPIPSFKADVYAFGVILMELLTRRSAGDIISGQSGAVDLADWVRLCAREGRGTDCFDRDIAGLEEAPRVMDELLAVSLKCILPVNERPNIRTVFDDLCSITL